MKIIGGQYKGRNFYRPKGIRPTQNVTRKAVFDILGQDLEGLSFLELFAGSGSIGLEAVSRGVISSVFVEKDPKFAGVIEENISLLNININSKEAPICEVIKGDAFAAIKAFCRKKATFDIIFIDPPYGRGLAKKALKTISAYDIVNANCTVIIEHEKSEILPEHIGRFLLFRQRKYGTTILSIYTCQENKSN